MVSCIICKSIPILICDNILGIDNELVRQLADTTVNDEQITEPLSQIRERLKFLDRGIRRNRKSLSMGDLFLQLYRMFDIWLKIYNDFIVIIGFVT